MEGKNLGPGHFAKVVHAFFKPRRFAKAGNGFYRAKHFAKAGDGIFYTKTFCKSRRRIFPNKGILQKLDTGFFRTKNNVERRDCRVKFRLTDAVSISSMKLSRGTLMQKKKNNSRFARKIEEHDNFLRSQDKTKFFFTKSWQFLLLLKKIKISATLDPPNRR